MITAERTPVVYRPLRLTDDVIELIDRSKRMGFKNVRIPRLFLLGLDESLAATTNTTTPSEISRSIEDQAPDTFAHDEEVQAIGLGLMPSFHRKTLYIITASSVVLDREREHILSTVGEYTPRKDFAKPNYQAIVPMSALQRGKSALSNTEITLGLSQYLPEKITLEPAVIDC